MVSLTGCGGGPREPQGPVDLAGTYGDTAFSAQDDETWLATQQAITAAAGLDGTPDAAERTVGVVRIMPHTDGAILLQRTADGYVWTFSKGDGRTSGQRPWPCQRHGIQPCSPPLRKPELKRQWLR